MKLPTHLKMTKRQFMQWKRQQFRAVCNMIDNSDITIASAYLPREQYDKLRAGVALINQARKELMPWWKKA